MHRRLATYLALAALGATACSEQGVSSFPIEPSVAAPTAADGGDALTSSPSGTDEHYEYRPPNRDGIGKIYLGREISHVMGHLGAGWLERPAREQEERTDLLIDGLPLTRDAVVADIGAGTGYFTFPVAARVPDGLVLAVDIQPEMLERIEGRRDGGLVRNVKTVLGTVTDPRLPPGGVDLIFIVDAYHEFSHPREMGLALAQALRPGGYLVLIEYRMEDPAVRIKPLHKMTEVQARREMAAIGLSWVETKTFLPKQHFMLFQKP